MKVFLFFLVLAAAFPVQADSDLLQALKQPGVHGLMRHALAPGTGDPRDFELSDCSTQRNLNVRGKQQARRIGARLREAQVTFDHVLSSQWCRCLETATLLDLGQVEGFIPINSFFQDGATKAAQTKAVKESLADVAGSTVLLVTHQVNITALTGRYPRSGEMFVIKIDGDGALVVLGSLFRGSY